MRAWALGLALLLAGCGGASGESAASEPPAVETEIEGGQEALDAEASANAAPTIEADDVAEWDNGLTAKITSVTTEKVDHEQYAEKGHDTAVTITVEITNGGDGVFVFDNPYMGPNGPRDGLYYGENLYEAQSWGDDVEGIDGLPKQIVPGSSVPYTELWTLPGEGLASLTFELTPDKGNLPIYTFTGVETLIA